MKSEMKPCVTAAADKELSAQPLLYIHIITTILVPDTTSNSNHNPNPNHSLREISITETRTEPEAIGMTNTVATVMSITMTL